MFMPRGQLSAARFMATVFEIIITPNQALHSDGDFASLHRRR
jgi:hypothetical protein